MMRTAHIEATGTLRNAIALLTALCIAESAFGQRDVHVIVRGTVLDSLSGRPMAGAVVQFAGADTAGLGAWFTARTDSLGAFVIRNVAPGNYLAGFYHPTLDSLGLEMRGQPVTVRGDDQVVRLASPSARTLVRTLCAGDNVEGSGLLLGHVRREETESAVSGGTVIASWAVARRSTDGFTIDEGSRDATTRDTGWFAVCGVPANAALTITAVERSDTSEAIDVRIARDSFAHIDVYLASRASRHSARVAGRVLDEHGTPVAGHLSVAGATEVAAVPDGSFVLDSLSAGTQMLRARAIGFEPQSSVIHLRSAATTRVEVRMSRRVILPATIVSANINAERLSTFEQHRRSSAGGYFIKPARLEGYESAPMPLRSFVAGLPGIYIDRNGNILMKRPNTYVDPRNPYVSCSPRIFYNGKPANLLDDQPDLSNVIGVEVYTRETQIPAVYPIPINKPCGLIVVWYGAR